MDKSRTNNKLLWYDWIFYLSFVTEVIAYIFLFLNNFFFLGINISGIAFFLILINSPILFGLSLVKLFDKKYLIPILGFILSGFGVILSVSVIVALRNFT